ncbi:MAG: insecticidal toxin complex protein [Saprospiraceae bacterium]|nr:insecticidal toxin complex protein [Candidatus Vicinibacter affinis]
MKGIDEKFSVNAVNGTAAFSIPLPVSPARGVVPQLSLSYNSGSGNGVFGLGWNLSLASIKRKTDKGLPQYMDGVDSDVYLFSEAEDLVPEFQKKPDGSFKMDVDNDYIIYERNSTDGLFTIRNYKPRIEGLFARIERWTQKSNGIIKWKITTRDNTTNLFGWTDNSVLADPSYNRKIFEWLPEFVFDDKGNCCHYIYKKEDATGLDQTLIHNRNRLKDGIITYTNLYLEKVLYGNRTPYQKFGDAFPIEENYFFQTILDYGEYDLIKPYQKSGEWTFRPDAFSDYKAGFEIRTTRLCRRILQFHHFDELPGGSALVKSLNITYDTSTEQDFTFLIALQSFGYIKKDDGTYSSKSLPATEFYYQKHDWNHEVKSIAMEDLVHAPVGLDEGQYQFTDLFNEGLSGILTEQGNEWFYKHNLGNGKFEEATLVVPKPSFNGLGGNMQLSDLDGDGGKQLSVINGDVKGYFELDDDNEWQNFKTFEQMPNLDFGDPNTRMLDLNGDGLPEVVITEHDVITWYESQGRKGYNRIHSAHKTHDEEAGPAIVFADSTQSIFLADMSGDGMTDIVRIRNGEVCYWPNLGYGKFGAKVAMDKSPVLDHPETFNPSYIKLADIDGSGTTDIIYLGKNTFSCWKNLSGNRFAVQSYDIEAFPAIHSNARISVTDLLGNGVACIVWSSNLPSDSQQPLKYIDLMNSKKPHIMVKYVNNMGKEVTMEYLPSTHFYIEDKLAGRPWITKLHFPVHCIAKTITADKITGHRFASTYKYHHGYYDHVEREFRGFGMVEQFDSEQSEHWDIDGGNLVDASLNQATVFTKSWVHTGAYLRNGKILSQFEKEYWYSEMIRQGYAVTHDEHTLPEAKIVDVFGNVVTDLTIEERREAVRACKSMPLRSEVFALDAPLVGATPDEIKKQLSPYTVATHNCVIERTQPKGKNKHAVFIVKESESISYSYERNTDDPRIAHNLNIKLDEYGNVLESAAVVYPRRIVNPDLRIEAREAQGKTNMIYTQNAFTNDVIDEDYYRLRMPSEVKTYELNSVIFSGQFYKLSDFENILSDTKSEVLLYHEINKPTNPGIAQRRLIEHIRSVYYRNDLTAALPLHQLESLGLPFENYQLAYTPELVTDIFGNKVDANILMEGKFSHSEDDDNWWIRSGTTQFLESGESSIDAGNRFYVPLAYIDPYGSKTQVKYYSDYYLFIEETQDAIGNVSRVDDFSFVTLSPVRMKDMNHNLSEVLLDELGLVKAMAIMGKGNEADDLDGLTSFTESAEESLIQNYFASNDSSILIQNGKDLLQRATARFVYDFEAYQRDAKPVVVSSIMREEHYQKNNDAPIQIGFEYTDGLGKVAMKKVQAEPGKAKKVEIDIDQNVIITNEDTSPHLRWIGNGRTVLNNKGNPVKQYEPYFSVSFQYEDLDELVEIGVTPLIYYDAVGRVIRTDMPDGSFSKTSFDSWEQKIYDAHDTVLDSVWYQERNSLPTNDSNKRAADKAVQHCNTPSQIHTDTLGRPISSIEHNKLANGNDEMIETFIHQDIESNVRKVIDARGNAVMEYKYNMLGQMVWQKSMDAGQRWLLTNIAGNPLRTWDERNHEFQYSYDVLHRPIESKVIDGDGDIELDHVYDKIVYGESEPDAILKNLRGQVIKHFDTGGLIDTPKYDFKGQPIMSSRYLFKKYKETANWTATSMVDDLETQAFTFITETDAIGRITKQTAPDGSIITPSYNEAGLLNGESVWHYHNEQTATYIKDIDYNEKGQRNKIVYGNNVTTRYAYDEKTFRLSNLKSSKANGDLLQDLYYTYDAVGNITTIEDKAIPIQFFANAIIEPKSEYTYDALYRLIEATGRENNVALNFGNQDNWNDAAYLQQLNAGQAMNMHTYTQKYDYDVVGNILRMQHQASGNNWTRTYAYESQNNRLKSTQIGSNTYAYTYHVAHGFMTSMSHLEDMGWNFKEEVVRTIRQKVNLGNGTAETTYYQYDGQGQRIRKITENAAGPGATPTLNEERIYIAGYELYKKHSGSDAGLERTSLSLLEEGHRFVMVESRNAVDDGTEAHLVRYQMHNHLGSTSLELNENADLISYEEYHPYGTTAYQATNAAIRSAAKRYRFTGMERDEESGLSYHSARYYITWLGRWLSADPLGIGDGVNVYGYCNNNPVFSIDQNGNQAQEIFNRNIKELIKKYGAENVRVGQHEENNKYIITIITKVNSEINDENSMFIHSKTELDLNSYKDDIQNIEKETYKENKVYKEDNSNPTKNNSKKSGTVLKNTEGFMEAVDAPAKAYEIAQSAAEFGEKYSKELISLNKKNLSRKDIRNLMSRINSYTGIDLRNKSEDIRKAIKSAPNYFKKIANNLDFIEVIDIATNVIKLYNAYNENKLETVGLSTYLDLTLGIAGLAMKSTPVGLTYSFLQFSATALIEIYGEEIDKYSSDLYNDLKNIISGSSNYNNKVERGFNIQIMEPATLNLEKPYIYK